MPSKVLVRIDQVLLARRLLAVGRDGVELQRLGERDLPRVVTREGGLDLGRDTIPKLLQTSAWTASTCLIFSARY